MAFDPDQYLQKKIDEEFNPDAYLTKEDTSAWGRFTAPLKNMSVADWEQKSLIAPWAKAAVPGVSALTSMYKGTTPEQETVDAYKNLYGKGEALAGGVKQLATSPVETVSKIAGHIAENPAGFAGEAVKGVIYDPEQLFIPGVGKAAETVARPIAGAARTVGGAVADTAAFPVRAARGALINEPFTGSSALTPLRETYYPKEIVDRFMKGQATLEELDAGIRPTSELRNDWKFRAAEKIAPTGIEPPNPANPTGGKVSLVPLKDRASEAFGERLIQGYKEQPLTLAADIGLPILSGGVVPPVGAVTRGAQIMADKYIANKLGFAPGFIEKLAAERAAAAARPKEVPPSVTGPAVPPTAGPEWFLPGQEPRFMPPNAGPQQFNPGPVMPESVMSQRVPQVATPATMNAEQRAMIEQIRRRGELQKQAQAALGENYKPPVEVKPVEPTPDQPLSAIEQYNRDEMFRKNPRMIHPDNPYLNLPGRRGPGNVSQMIVPGTADDTFKALTSTGRKEIRTGVFEETYKTPGGIVVKETTFGEPSTSTTVDWPFPKGNIKEYDLGPDGRYTVDIVDNRGKLRIEQELVTGPYSIMKKSNGTYNITKTQESGGGFYSSEYPASGSVKLLEELNMTEKNYKQKIDQLFEIYDKKIKGNK